MLVIDLIGKLPQEMHSENPKVGGTKAIGEFGIIAVPESQRRTADRHESRSSGFEQKPPKSSCRMYLAQYYVYYVPWSPICPGTPEG